MLLQTGVLVGGALLTRAVMKLFGYKGWNHSYWDDFPVFVRNWGILLLLIPAAWALTTIWMEEKTEYFGQGSTLLTGKVLLLLLAVAMAASVGAAASPHGLLTVSRYQ